MGLLAGYRAMGRGVVESELEPGETLLTFAHGQIHEGLGGEALAHYLPLSSKSARSAPCLVGVTDRRVLFVRPNEPWKESRVISVPPSMGVVTKPAGMMSYLTVQLNTQRFRFYPGRTFRQELHEIAEALGRLSPAEPFVAISADDRTCRQGHTIPRDVLACPTCASSRRSLGSA